MSRIIRTTIVGKPVKRITVDVDASGEVKVNGQMKGPLGQTVPLSMFDVCTTLANVVASSLLAMGGGIPVKTAPVHPGFKYPDSTGHEFLACDDNEVICQLCGGHKGNHDAKT